MEQPTDILPLEKTSAFRGRYHSLGGRISPLDRVAPEDLRIAALLDLSHELDDLTMDETDVSVFEEIALLFYDIAQAAACGASDMRAARNFRSPAGRGLE